MDIFKFDWEEGTVFICNWTACASWPYPQHLAAAALSMGSDIPGQLNALGKATYHLWALQPGRRKPALSVEHSLDGRNQTQAPMLARHALASTSPALPPLPPHFSDFFSISPFCVQLQLHRLIILRQTSLGLWA